MKEFNLKTADIEKLFRERTPKVIGMKKSFSVLVPLVEKDGRPHLLYEVRAKNLDRQPGEVCFPGGEIEEGETPLQAAVRETVEELGISEDETEVICELDAIHNYTNFSMYCFLGRIAYESVKNAKPNAAEVEELFLVPLEEILEAEPYIYKLSLVPKTDDFPNDIIGFPDGYPWRKGTSDVPIYRGFEHVIWGLTGRITRNFLEIIKQSRSK
ncbi:MAG: CoA pyrophosphatase [Clostridia bacterium]|nr:CoA pyrophosphatase [Clostridia bacterium]